MSGGSFQTWHDGVRLALFICQGITALLLIKLLVLHGRWRRPWRGDAPLFIALLCLLVVLSRVRAYALGTGPFPETWPTAVNVVGYVALLVWLLQRVDGPWVTWQRRRRAARPVPHGPATGRHQNQE